MNRQPSDIKHTSSAQKKDFCTSATSSSAQLPIAEEQHCGLSISALKSAAAAAASRSPVGLNPFLSLQITQEHTYEGCTAVVFPKLIAVSFLNISTFQVFSPSPSDPLKR